MKLKSILLTAVATLGLTAATMAQNVPNYVPTNGLVGWWPFNGNANDESGNGNNGTVSGATLTTDRNGQPNQAFNLSTIGSKIDLFTGFTNLTSSRTISFWFKNTHSSNTEYIISYRPSCLDLGENYFEFYTQNGNVGYAHDGGIMNSVSYSQNDWVSIILTFNNGSGSLYYNGVLIASMNTGGYQPMNQNAIFGVSSSSACISNFGLNDRRLIGDVDDIGLWARVLSQQEISDLYNALNCSNNTNITPQTNSLLSGSTALFAATTSDPNPSYVWQSDFGQGFQTLNNFGNYSGVNSATLNIANVQLPNHTQPVRVISTSGNCVDTSNVAVINILDTCLVTVYDTLLTTVTDTLVINATITGINPPNNLNTLKVFPNPASTHITIDYGNFNAMSGYTLTIVNSIGQTVFTTPINQQTSYIDLSTWTGDGIYFVQIINPQNNTIENRKIVIQ